MTAFPPTQVVSPAVPVTDQRRASSTPPAPPPEDPAEVAARSGLNKHWLTLAALIGIVGGGITWYMSNLSPFGAPSANTAQTPASQAAAALTTPTSPASTPTISAPAPTAAASTPATAPPAMPATREPFTTAAALEDIVRNADPLMAVNTITNKSQVTIGKDKLLFQVKSSVPGYLYVYLAGTDASHFYLLFPNALDNNNRIEANKLVELPRKGWHITADGPAGVDHIVTLVSPTPRDLSKLGLNTQDTIPEFDMGKAAKAWAEHKGPGSPFVGPALCDGAAPCDERYGASLVHIEEVAR